MIFCRSKHGVFEFFFSIQSVLIISFRFLYFFLRRKILKFTSKSGIETEKWTNSFDLTEVLKKKWLKNLKIERKIKQIFDSGSEKIKIKKYKRKQSECGAVYLCYAAVRSHSANGLTNGVVIHEIRQNIKPVTKAQHKH